MRHTPLLLVLLATACFDPALPSGAQVSCADDQDCPQGAECATSISRCFALGREDQTAPTMSATLTPTAARAAQLVTLTVTASETLFVAPQARAGEVLTFVVDEEASSPEDARWVLTARPTGTEADGAHPVSVDLVDVSGNEAVRLPAGDLTLDFQPPAATSVLPPLPAVANAAATITASVTWSESLPDAPEARAIDASGQGLAVEVSGEGTTWLFSVTPTTGDGEGIYDWSVVGRDAAGNESPSVELGATRLDFTAPTVVSTQLPPPAAPGKLVVVTVELSEPAQPPPTLDIDQASGVVFELDGVSGPNLSWSALLSDEIVDGDWTLTLGGLRDEAGNAPATPPVIGVLAVDAVLPTIISLSPSATSLLANDVLTLDIVVSEPLLAAPTLLLGGVPLVLTSQPPIDGGTPAYSYELSLGTTSLVGTFALSVTMADTAGNNASESSAFFSIDAVAPQIVDVTFTPPVAPKGARAVLTVLVSEPLDVADPLELLWDRLDADAFAELDFSFPAYTFSLDVDASTADGLHVLEQIRLTDVAGNVATIPRGDMFSVDNIEPVVGDISFLHDAGYMGPDDRFSLQQGFNIVEIEVQVDDASGDPVLVNGTLDGRPMRCVVTPTTPNVTCDHTLVAATDSEGTYPIVITAFDAAGNVASNSTTATIDLSGPAASNPSASYRPSAANPLSVVQAMGPEATSLLTFVLDEPPATDPSIELSDNVTTVPVLSPVAVDGLVIRVVVADPPPSDGNWDVIVTAVDAVGNSATTTLPGAIAVDVMPPAPIDTTTPGRVVHTRIPWGADSTAGEFFGGLLAGPGAADEKGTILVLDHDTGAELVRGMASSDGSFDIELRGDVLGPDLVLVDGAGNPSAPARVLEGRWVATFNGKVAGTNFPNPHQAEAMRVASSTLDVSGTDLDGAALESDDDASHAALGDGRWEWIDEQQETIPGASMTVDPTTSTALTFGGAGMSVGSELYKLRGADAVTDAHLTRPIPRIEAAVTFDTRRGVLLMYGGRSGSMVSLADFWEWSAATGWSELSPTTPSPGQVRSGTLVYQAHSGNTLLFTGRTAKTWQWDGAAWTDHTPPPGQGPDSRQTHAAYDPDRRRVVLFGGEYDRFKRMNDVWEWDGAAWQGPLGLADPRPPEQKGPVAFDPQRDAVVVVDGFTKDLWAWGGEVAGWSRTQLNDVFGGVSGVWFDADHERLRFLPSSANEDRTRELRESGWMIMTTNRPNLPPREGASAAWAGDKLIVFGGDDGNGLVDETWARHNGVDWWLEQTTSAPPPQAYAAMSWDGEKLLLTGLGETWSYDQGDWTPIATIPMPNSRGAMAYDPVRDVVMRVDENGATHEWDRSVDDWTELTPGNAPKSGRWCSLAFHPTAGGGGRIQLFDASQQVLQEYNPQAPEGWLDVATSIVRLNGVRPALAADSGAWVHFAGSWGLNVSTDTAMFRPGPFASEAVGPLPRSFHSLTWQPDRERIVLPADGTPSDGLTWELDSGASLRPAIAVRFDFRTSGVPVDQVVGVELDAVAGGTYDSGVGAALLVWDSGYYRSRTANNADDLTPTELSVVVGAADVLKLFHKGELRAQVRPDGANGTGAATVALDYIEVAVDYRLP